MTDGEVNFQKAVTIILNMEGGYSYDANDPGGETNFGISKRAHPDLDIKSLTVDDAIDLYKRLYWAPVQGDALPYPLALFVFDAAVNEGVSAAIHLLQKTLGVAPDGVLGPDTLKHAQSRDHQETAAQFMANRALRYTATSGFIDFGRGWFDRLFNVCLFANS